MADLFDLDIATDLDTQKLPIQTVNGVKPDSKGNIAITSVANATKATQDSAGQQINTTYVKGVTASNATITVTKGNGTTSTATINNVANATNATKASQNASGYALANTIVKSIAISGRTITVTKIDGTSYTLTTQDTNTVYTKLSQFANDVGFITSAGSCAHAKTADSATNATKATQDSAGQQINTTYIKGVSVSGRTVTFTRGNGTTFAITTQDTNAIYGITKLGTRSANGTWTLTGVSTTKPLFLFYAGNSNNPSNCQIRITSGALDASTVGLYILGRSQGYNESCTFKPTSANVNIYCSNLGDDDHLEAWQ